MATDKLQPLPLRIHPTMSQELNAEADEKGMVLSDYVRFLLTTRKQNAPAEAAEEAHKLRSIIENVIKEAKRYGCPESVLRKVASI